MRIAYFDCFSGASGDMILGSLVDAGLSLEHLKAELGRLRLAHYDLQAKKVVKRGLGGTQVIIRVDGRDHHHQHLPHNHHHHEHRHLYDIKDLILESSLDEWVKRKSIEIFTRLAEAEAKVHRTTIEQIHFHEVGAMDAIIDVVGSVIGFSALRIEKIYGSPLHVGTGTVNCAHGMLPVPAPATLELVKGKPVYSIGIKGELLTPTGAAILTTMAAGFGPMPALSLEAVGYGAGTLDPPVPNLLRVSIGEGLDEARGYQVERVAVIETNIDDMNPQMYDYVIQRILDLGALDVFLAPIQMKKNRPGTLVSVICPPEMVEKFSDFLLKETTTIGLRWRLDHRLKAHRTIKEVPTRFGAIKFKVAQVDDRIINVSPEYDDCKRAALENRVPLREVMDEARSLALEMKLESD